MSEVRRPTNNFYMRLFGAAALDPAIYEEVEADRGATLQAFAVVVLSSLAAGFGSRGFQALTVSAIAFFGIVALLAWAAWALLTFVIGTQLMPEPQTRADLGELLRTIGFASTPGVLRILGVIPGVTWPAFVISSFWMLGAMVVAVRQALDYSSTSRAIAVCVVGGVLSAALALGLGVIFGPTVS